MSWHGVVTVIMLRGSLPCNCKYIQDIISASLDYLCNLAAEFICANEIILRYLVKEAIILFRQNYEIVGIQHQQTVILLLWTQQRNWLTIIIDFIYTTVDNKRIVTCFRHFIPITLSIFALPECSRVSICKQNTSFLKVSKRFTVFESIKRPIKWLFY